MSLLSSMTARRSQRPSGELFAPRVGTGFRIVADLMTQCRSTMQPFGFNNGRPNWLFRIRPDLPRWPNCRLSSQGSWTSLAASDSSQLRRRPGTSIALVALICRPQVLPSATPGIVPSRLRFWFRKLADPNIPEADRVIVVLKRQRQLGRVSTVGRPLLVLGRTHEGDVVLNEDAVVQDCDERGLEQLAVFVKARPVEDDVVGLPLARRTAGVDQGRVLPVDRRGLPVRVGLTFVGIKDLNFIQAH